MTYIIYRHINKFNGKSYVGLTSQKATRRWRNGFGYKESPIFYTAIKKYGFDKLSEVAKLNFKNTEKIKENLL